MEKTQTEKAISKINEELEKLKAKNNNIYFFVLDTDGYASGSLAYIYHLATLLQEEGYNVAMLYQSEEKGDAINPEDIAWLNDRYTHIPHYDIQSNDIEISASDILFIPEIFSQVMNQTKKLPCKRIVIMQNYDYILAQMPYSAQWGDYGITEAISNTDENAKLLTDIFPYIKTSVIDPYIDEVFGETLEPKKMIINVIARNQDDVTRLVKPFYWKYPLLKWVSFRDLRGFSQEKMANALREGFLTIWIDEPSSFGYSAIEAMKCGNIVFAKTPQISKKWMFGKDGKPSDACIWFDQINDMHKSIATLVRGFLTDTIQDSLYAAQESVKQMYSEKNTKSQILNYIQEKIDERIIALEELIKIGENNTTNTEEA